jgi:hypothetical protein
MTRFAWRQSQNQTVLVTAALATLAILAAFTGVHLSHLYDDLIKPCGAGRGCGLAIGEFTNHYVFLQNALQFLLRIAPALIGVFWGAPLIARELETGSYRLAWTQTVSRSRWVVTKLAVVGGAAVLITGLLTLTITWWYRALDSLNGSMFPVIDARGVLPIGYTFFAFMLGALAGAVIRRTLPAMAATLAVFVFARIAVQTWVRPHLMPSRHLTASILGAPDFGFMSRNGGPPLLVARADGPPGSWVLHNQLVDSSGHVATAAERAAFVAQHCPNIGPPPLSGNGKAVPVPPGVGDAINSCQEAAARTFHVLVTYQPASHYWPLQWLELGLYAVLGLAAAAACVWWVTRRIV